MTDLLKARRRSQDEEYARFRDKRYGYLVSVRNTGTILRQAPKGYWYSDDSRRLLSIVFLTGQTNPKSVAEFLRRDETLEELPVQQGPIIRSQRGGLE